MTYSHTFPMLGAGYSVFALSPFGSLDCLGYKANDAIVKIAL